MAVYALTDAEILAGPLRLTGRSNEVDLALDVTALDKTTFDSSGWRELLGGLKMAKASTAGLYDADVVESGALNFDSELFSELGGSQYPLTICPVKTDGGVAYIGGIRRANLAQFGNVGELAAYRSDMWGDGVFARGALIHPANVLRTATAVGTAVTLGTVASGRSIVAAIHVLAVTGTSPQLTVVVQRDDNSGFTSPTTVATLGPVSAPTSSLTVVAGPITPDDRYRVSYTISGTNPSARFAAAVGITPA